MAKPLEDEPLRASVLDRLQGDQGHGKFSGRQTLSQLIESVHVSLENLLNTRWRVTVWPPALGELQRSLVNYGIPDFTAVNISSPSARTHFGKLLEEAIRIHEPRFKKVRVDLIENEDRLDRTLRFRIDAELYASPDPVQVKFDSQLDPTSHRIRVDTHR